MSFISGLRQPLAELARAAFAITNVVGLPLYHLGDIADTIEGTVGGVEKPLVDRWRDALTASVEAEGYPLGTHTADYLLPRIHGDMMRQAQAHMAQGMSRHDAQKAVLVASGHPHPRNG